MFVVKKSNTVSFAGSNELAEPEPSRGSEPGLVTFFPNGFAAVPVVVTARSVVVHVSAPSDGTSKPPRPSFVVTAGVAMYLVWSAKPSLSPDDCGLVTVNAGRCVAGLTPAGRTWRPRADVVVFPSTPPKSFTHLPPGAVLNPDVKSSENRTFAAEVGGSVSADAATGAAAMVSCCDTRGQRHSERGRTEDIGHTG